MSTASPPLPDMSSAIAMMLRGGREALNLGSFDLAETLGREVLTYDSANAEAHVILGRALFYTKKYPQAVEHLAAGLSPAKQPEVWIELARGHQTLFQWSKAISAFETAYTLKPPTALQEAELGHAFSNNKQFALAVAAFARAAALDATSPEIWIDLGAAQLELGELEGSLRSFESALQLKPDNHQALSNVVLVYEVMQDAAGALATADRLVATKPTDPAMLQKRGVVRLSRGQLVSGWTDYRARLSNPAHKGWHVGIPKPMWDGVSSLSDKGVLVWSDQGLGDQILTASLLPDALAAAKNVLFSCEPRLAALIQRSFPGARTVSLFDVPFGRADLSESDVQASISELGPAFRPDVAHFPKHTGYLKADPAKVAELKARYAALPGQGPIVGLSWRSSHDVAGEHKSVSLEHWARVLKTPGVRFVSLQYGNATADIAASGANIFVDPNVNAMQDVDLFAAQVAAMDVIISTSNTTVHMAGALGVPTLCLTPFVEGRPWYWFVGHDVSPWYPSVRHIWQTQRRQWGDVMGRAATSLREMIESKQ